MDKIRHSRLGEPAALCGVLLLGAALRLGWIDYGLPEVVYVDSFKFVGAAAQMAHDGDFQPREFQNPALYANLLALIYRILGLDSIYAQHLAARLVSVFAGLGLMWTVWRAGRRALPAQAALLATALAGWSPTLVTLSRTTLTDVMLVWFMSAGLSAALAEPMRPRHLGAAGIWLGLAVATKWTGLYLALFYGLLALVEAVRRRDARKPAAALAMALAVGAVVFLATNPHFAAHTHEYWERMKLETGLQRHGAVGRVQGGWLDYLISLTPTWETPWLGTSLLGELGPVLFAAALAGWGWALLRPRRSRTLWLHALYVVVYLGLIVRPGAVKTIRYLTPILPSLFMLVAGLVGAVCARIPEGSRRLGYGLAVCLLAATPLIHCVRAVVAARRPMTPMAAEGWIRAHLGDEPGVAVSPFFLDNLERLPHTPLFMTGVYGRQYRVGGDPNFDGESAPIYTPGLLDEMRSQGIRYFVANSWFDDSFLPVAENVRWFPRSTAGYAGWRVRLESEGELVWSVRAAEAGCLGPDVEIWKID